MAADFEFMEGPQDMAVIRAEIEHVRRDTQRLDEALRRTFPVESGAWEVPKSILAELARLDVWLEQSRS